MFSLFKQIRKRKRTSTTQIVYSTDLLEPEIDLRNKIAQGVSLWEVRVRLDMDNDETGRFYRNLHRLNRKHGVGHDSFRFIFPDSSIRARAVCEQLKRLGFNNVDLPEVREESDKTLVFKTFNVAGTRFYFNSPADFSHILHSSLIVELRHEPDNEYDDNAVAVYVRDTDTPKDNPFKIGYIPRTANTEIAALYRAGHADILQSRITRIDTDTPNPEITVIVTVIPKNKGAS